MHNGIGFQATFLVILPTMMVLCIAISKLSPLCADHHAKMEGAGRILTLRKDIRTFMIPR